MFTLEKKDAIIGAELVGYGVVRFRSDFGQIFVRFLDIIGQIVRPTFGNFAEI